MINRNQLMNMKMNRYHFERMEFMEMTKMMFLTIAVLLSACGSKGSKDVSNALPTGQLSNAPPADNQPHIFRFVFCGTGNFSASIYMGDSTQGTNQNHGIVNYQLNGNCVDAAYGGFAPIQMSVVQNSGTVGLTAQILRDEVPVTAQMPTQGIGLSLGLLYQ